MLPPFFLFRRACWHQSPRQASPVCVSQGYGAQDQGRRAGDEGTEHPPEPSPCPGALSSCFHAVQSLHQSGQLEKAIHTLSSISRPSPDPTLYLSLLKACIQRKALHLARAVGSHLSSHREELPCFLNDYVVVSLARCGGADEALRLARALTHRTVYSWTAIISACVDCGRSRDAISLYGLMQRDGVVPDRYTIVSALKACGDACDLEAGERLHEDARQLGFLSDLYVGNTLVSMYGKTGAIDRAEDVFCGLTKHNEVSCNAMLSVYVENGHGEKALRLYRQMQDDRICCDGLTFAVATQACLILAGKEDPHRCPKAMALEIGRALHFDAETRGFAADAFVCNMLISLYGKLGALAEAESTFGKLFLRDIRSWTVMFCAYVEQGHGERALQFYRQMHVNGIHPDAHMFVTAFHACVALAERKEALLGDESFSARRVSLDIGLALHEDAKRRDLASDVFVNTAVLTLYWKCGKLTEAEGVFGELRQRTIVSWTAMLSAYVEHDQHAKALCLYQEMRREPVAMDDVMLICVLQACSETGNLEVCKDLHFTIASAGEHGQKISLPATLVHAYSSCAGMDDAKGIFEGFIQPDVVSWGACIAGYAAEGSFMASLQMFSSMELEGIRPNEVLFASVLSACSHSGLVSEALGYFDSMLGEYAISRSMKHYINLVDLFGRAGDFGKLENMLTNMPMQADITVWLCVLGMCLRHGQLQLAERAFDNAVDLRPSESTAYVLMSNIYAIVKQGDPLATEF